MSFYFVKKLHVSGSSSAHRQEFSTVHSALVYVMQVWWHIPVPNVQWKTPDGGQRNCLKHVEFLDKKNWEISASVGFIKKKSSILITKNREEIVAETYTQQTGVHRTARYIPQQIT